MEGAQVIQVKVISYYLQSQVKWAYNNDLKLKSLENWVKDKVKFEIENEYLSWNPSQESSPPLIHLP